MSKLYLHEMTAPEVEQRLAAGNDCAILPVASIEMHGPHLLYGTDAYVAEAIACELARKTGALVLPTVSYTWAGFTGGFAGTISLSPPRVYEHLWAVLEATVAAGFRRVVILSFHGGNRWYAPQLARHFFEETGVPVLQLDVFSRMRADTDELFPGEWKDGWEASLLLASLQVLGKSALLPESKAAYDGPKPEPMPASLDRVSGYGVVGVYVQALEHHVQPTSKVSRQKGREWITRLVEKSASVFDDLGAWAADAARLRNRGPAFRPDLPGHVHPAD